MRATLSFTPKARHKVALHFKNEITFRLEAFLHDLPPPLCAFCDSTAFRIVLPSAGLVQLP